MGMLDSEELRKYIYDPSRMQHKILEYMESANDGTIDIVDPTNPFTMLLEATAVNAINPLIEMRAHSRIQYPDLAISKEELYPHLNDQVLTNMFGVPATANIVFYINVMELKQNGYRPSGANYTETVIPEFTEVIVADTYFTLLNDVVVRLYDEGGVFIEQQTSDLEIAVTGLGILPGVIINDSESNSWIIFETIVKQVKRTIVRDTIIVTEGYEKTMLIDNQYCFSDVEYRNSQTNGSYIKLAKAHDDKYINPKVPTVYIKQNDNSVTFKIPDVYLLESGVSGNTNVITYDTKGNIYLPINTYKTDDFAINLGNIGKSPSSSTSPNITILANSRYVVDGGRDEMGLDELKQTIVNNTTGANEIPITDSNIEKLGTFNNFEITKAIDIITNRVYMASRNTSIIESQLVNARADIFTNKTKIVIGNYLNNRNIHLDKDVFVIRSNTLFKEDNGVVTIVSEDELNTIDLLGKVDMLTYFKMYKYFYTPYYYVIDKTDTVVNSRVYDLDNPSLDKLKLIGKNINVIPRVNIDKYLIEKVLGGYRITMSLIGNSAFESLDATKVLAQLKISMYNSVEYVYYEATYDADTSYIVFNISSDDYIDTNDNIHLTNGVSALSTTIIKLISTAEILLYTVDAGILDTSHYLNEDLYITVGDYVTVLSKESIEINFGEKLDYIWNKLHAEYSERKYLKYSIDIPATYTEVVYETDPNSGSIFSINKVAQVLDSVITVESNALYYMVIESVKYEYTSDGSATLAEIQNGLIAAINSSIVNITKTLDGLKFTAVTEGLPFSFSNSDNITSVITTEADSDVAYNILHDIGDPVLDSDNNTVYKYRKGDVVLDENNLPIVDQNDGVIRYIDILMLEYEYFLADSTVYKNYKQLCMNSLKLWLTEQLPSMNDTMLENTSILYKAYKSAIPVKVIFNNNLNNISYLVKPDVTLYVRINTYTIDELKALKNKIGYIIHNKLDESYVSINNIKTIITNDIDENIVGVKISGLDNAGNLEVFNIQDKTVRLVLDKKLSINDNDELIVDYDIELNIEKI